MTPRRVALVTGAAAGIGKAISLRLAQDGMAVGVLDIDPEGCLGVAAQISESVGQAIALPASVADRAELTAAAAKLRAAYGPITVLVNNAGIAIIRNFEDLTDELWDRTFDINLKGAFIATQIVLPDMKAAGWGRIVNISSSSAQTGAERIAHYAASKGGMLALTKALAAEFGPLGITVNSIAPSSIVNTKMSAQNAGTAPISYETLAATLPVRRTGQPEDVAQACAWVVSEQCGFVTGQTISVNGGRVMP
jgi:2-hydroxycyclohexanecarboxyl-CoA dehydrogenase